MNLTSGSSALNEPLTRPDLLQEYTLDKLDFPGYKFVTQISSDSAFEGGSNRSGDFPSSRDSGEQGVELDVHSRRIGSLGSRGEKQSKLSATANSKNRAAQKRYRERQKGKMETYRQQVEELNQRLSLLQTENESLEKRNNLLEKVVQMKDQSPKAPAPEPEQVSEEPGSNLWQNTGTYAAVAEYINAVRKQRTPLVTPQDARSISPEDLRQVKTDYVKELAALLLAHGDDQNSDGFRQLEEYVLKTRLASTNLLRSMSVRSFAQLLAMKKRLSLVGQISERIMLALKLTPDQKRKYVAARKALVARNEEIKEKRRRVVATLELAVPSVAPLMCGQTAAMLRACESSDQFKESLEEEHRSMAQFHIDCVQVLTPLQEARTLLEMHPGAPDAWLISGYLEAEQDGCLAEWLQAHSGGQQKGQTSSLAHCDVSCPNGGLQSSFKGTQCCDAHSKMPADGISGVPPALPAHMPNLEPLPLQTTPSGLLTSPSFDLAAGLDGFGQDDMWVDFFPELLSQPQTS